MPHCRNGRFFVFLLTLESRSEVPRGTLSLAFNESCSLLECTRMAAFSHLVRDRMLDALCVGSVLKHSFLSGSRCTSLDGAILRDSSNIWLCEMRLTLAGLVQSQSATGNEQFRLAPCGKQIPCSMHLQQVPEPKRGGDGGDGGPGGDGGSSSSFLFPFLLLFLPSLL